MIDPGIAGLVARKYQLEQQQLDSTGRLQGAQAGYLGAQTSAYPAEAAAREAALRGQAMSAAASAHLQDVNAGLAPGVAQSMEGLQGAQTQQTLGQAGLVRTQAQLLPWQFNLESARSLHSMNPGIDEFGNPQLHSRGTSDVQPSKGAKNYKKGTGKVPGKGSSSVDSVPSMLAPGEAVLNAGAAQHLGRNVIDLLNAVGESKMGGSSGTGPGASDAEAQTSGGMPGYASGTDMVRRERNDPRPGDPSETMDQMQDYMGSQRYWGSPSDSTQNMNMSGGGGGRGPTPLNASNQRYEMNHGGSRNSGMGPTMQIPGYAWGTPDVKPVPAPGQTSSNGTWEQPAQSPTAAAIAGSGLTRVPRVVPKPASFARGTSEVPAKGAARSQKSEGAKKAPQRSTGEPPLNPQLLRAVLAMGGGMGGGLPAQGSVSPLQMPLAR